MRPLDDDETTSNQSCTLEQNCNEFSLFTNDFFSSNFGTQDKLSDEETKNDIWLKIDSISFLKDKF